MFDSKNGKLYLMPKEVDEFLSIINTFTIDEQPATQQFSLSILLAKHGLDLVGKEIRLILKLTDNQGKVHIKEEGPVQILRVEFD